MRKEASSQIVRFMILVWLGAQVFGQVILRKMQKKSSVPLSIYVIGKASTYFKLAKRHMLPSESSFLLEAYCPLSVYFHQVHMII